MPKPADWCEVSCAHCGDVLCFVRSTTSANVGPLSRVLMYGASVQTVACEGCRRGELAFRWGRLVFRFVPD